jgi:hypothetical protein
VDLDGLDRAPVSPPIQPPPIDLGRQQRRRQAFGLATQDRLHGVMKRCGTVRAISRRRVVGQRKDAACTLDNVLELVAPLPQRRQFRFGLCKRSAHSVAIRQERGPKRSCHCNYCSATVVYFVGDASPSRAGSSLSRLRRALVSRHGEGNGSADDHACFVTSVRAAGFGSDS